jgi:hypothetical protein
MAYFSKEASYHRRRHELWRTQKTTSETNSDTEMGTYIEQLLGDGMGDGTR